MIFTMLGTNPYSFDRLVRPLDDLADKNKWDVFVQLGHTTYLPAHCEYKNFLTKDEMLQHIESSELIICHGGFGSIRDSLSYNKPIVTVPRKPELNESQDHQEEMVKELEESGYVIAVYDIADLEEAIHKAKTFAPKERENSRIPSIINEFMYS